MDLVTISSLAQPQLDSQPACEPISLLPNELVQSILSRLVMQELVHLQLVCKKWQAVICSIGHSKKSLCLAKGSKDRRYDIDHLKKRSFELIDSSTFTSIKVKPYSSEHLQSQMGKLFVNIKSIAMDLPLSDILAVLSQLNQLTTLSITFNQFTSSNEYIDKLLKLINLCVSMKRFDIRALIYSQISILAPTLARLEQFSYSSYDPSLVLYFGQNCSRVSLDIFYEKDRTQWHTINGEWLANVTHLDLNGVRALDLLIEYLSKHALALQVLRLDNACLGPFVGTRMTSRMIGHLNKLEHLSELGLTHILFDLLQLKEAVGKFKFISLASIQTFTLANSAVNCQDSNIFTSVLCVIFPNVERLTFKSYYNFKFEGIEQHLGRFTKLRSYSFN